MHVLTQLFITLQQAVTNGCSVPGLRCYVPGPGHAHHGATTRVLHRTGGLLYRQPRATGALQPHATGPLQSWELWTFSRKSRTEYRVNLPGVSDLGCGGGGGTKGVILPQMGQIRDFSRSDFNTLLLLFWMFWNLIWKVQQDLFNLGPIRPIVVPPNLISQ